jgi:predicted RNA-binding protein with PUA-like domain
LPKYWLFKSDPATFGLEELERSPRRETSWDGVRNYQARNFLRDEVRVGDRVLFYHSQVKSPAVVGTARVVRAGYPDPTQFDPRHAGHDPRASEEQPRWYAVDIRLERRLPRPVELSQLRRTPGLEEMILLRKGSRLSIQPLTTEEWKTVLLLSKARSADG